jgi:hypothetical protein
VVGIGPVIGWQLDRSVTADASGAADDRAELLGGSSSSRRHLTRWLLDGS